MNYILKICTRYLNPEANTSKSWAFKEYNGACNKMIEGLESLQRLIMATELTGAIGYTIILTEWIGGNKYENVARINYDLAL